MGEASISVEPVGLSFREGLERFGRHAFLRKIRRGEILRVGRGLYQWPGRQAGIVEQIQALQSIARRQLVACGPTAAQLQGFEWISDPRLHLTTLNGRAIGLSGPVVLRQKMPLRIVEVDGVLVTDSAETAVDLACGARAGHVLQYLDAGLRAAVTLVELQAAVHRIRGHRGVVAVRDWLPWASPLAESPPESWVRQRLIAGGLVDVEPQVDVSTGTGRRRLDLGWREYRVGCEYDGEEFHTGDGSLERDRRRGAAFDDLDWKLVHLVRADLRALDRPVSRIRKHLETRGWRRPPVEPPAWPIRKRSR